MDDDDDDDDVVRGSAWVDADEVVDDLSKVGCVEATVKPTVLVVADDVETGYDVIS